MIPDGNPDLHKGINSTINGNYIDKVFFLIIYISINTVNYLKQK